MHARLFYDRHIFFQAKGRQRILQCPSTRRGPPSPSTPHHPTRHHLQSGHPAGSGSDGSHDGTDGPHNGAPTTYNGTRAVLGRVLGWCSRYSPGGAPTTHRVVLLPPTTVLGWCSHYSPGDGHDTGLPASVWPAARKRCYTSLSRCNRGVTKFRSPNQRISLGKERSVTPVTLVTPINRGVTRAKRRTGQLPTPPITPMRHTLFKLNPQLFYPV
jgi:hypothetical protein